LVRSELRAGDAVLVKASRGVQPERALAVLDAEGIPPPPYLLGKWIAFIRLRVHLVAKIAITMNLAVDSAFSTT